MRACLENGPGGLAAGRGGWAKVRLPIRCAGNLVRGARCVGATALWLGAGCSRAPSFDILGSLFPAWLVCLVVGIVLTVFARWLFLRLKIAIVLPILVYPGLTALLTFLLWLLFFS